MKFIVIAPSYTRARNYVERQRHEYAGTGAEHRWQPQDVIVLVEPSDTQHLRGRRLSSIDTVVNLGARNADIEQMFLTMIEVCKA